MTVESNTHSKGEQRPLNMRQLRFVTEYVATGNATQSAHLAGYAHPNVQAFRLLGGAFLADLDLEEPDEPAFDSDIFKDNKDLH